MFVIAAPGTRYGPCISCSHDACLRQIETAQTACYLCSQAIGFRTAMCFDASARPLHLSCTNGEVQRQFELFGIPQSERLMIRPIVFDKPEAAELLHIGRGTLDELVASDAISRVKIGTRILFTPDQLLSFLKRRSVVCREERGLYLVKRQGGNDD